MLQNKITLTEFKKQKKIPDHHESELQCGCVKWFDYQHNNINKLLFAVPNGGSRNGLEAKIMKGEGVRSGVSDLILLIPKGGYSCLCIELKFGEGVQSPEQKSWQKLVEEYGAKYVVCWTFDEFRYEVETYLAEPNSAIPDVQTKTKQSPLELYMISKKQKQ